MHVRLKIGGIMKSIKIYILLFLLATSVHQLIAREAPLHFDYMDVNSGGGYGDLIGSNNNSLPSFNHRISDNMNVFYSSFRKNYAVPAFTITIFNDFPKIPEGPIGMLITLIFVGIGFILMIYILFEVYLFISFLFGGR